MASKVVNKFYNWTFLFVVIAIIVVVNIIGIFINKRFDATQDKRYSLHESTAKYLSDPTNFDDRIVFKIFLGGNLPAEVVRLRTALEDKLKDFKRYAGKRVEYVIEDPYKGTEEEKNQLFEDLYSRGKGLIPTGIRYSKDGKDLAMQIWAGALIEYGGSTVNQIQFLPGTSQGQFYLLDDNFNQVVQNSINNLEYMLVSAIRRTTTRTKARIAFLHGHGELNKHETMRVRSLISPYYKIEDITLNDSIDALKNVKGLIIARPQGTFSEKDKYLIDQFVMNGGRLMCFIDKLTFDKDTLNRTGVTHTERTNLDLDKMLFDYGLKVNDNYAVDARCAPKYLPQSETGAIPWYFSIVATPTAHPISRNINGVLLKYASEVQFVGESNKIAQTPILTTSTNASITGLAPLLSLAMPLNYGNDPKFNEDPTNEDNKVCLGGLVEGTFTSHFKNRIVDAFAKSKEVNYLTESKTEGKVLVVGNGSFIRNMYDSIPNKMGGYNYTPTEFNNLKYDEINLRLRGFGSLVYGNQEFFQNMVDYMMGDNSILDIRSKQIEIHAIDKVKVEKYAPTLRVINMIVPSLIILILGLILFAIRKKKYTRK
ncbi:MAG TPA: Gldg family protein [Crocinitomicaceae bacterium]|nr:Gldg family protein [Crocinitomicaceae bacterium]